jgi:hypothetical protein
MVLKSILCSLVAFVANNDWILADKTQEMSCIIYKCMLSSDFPLVTGELLNIIVFPSSAGILCQI